MRNFYIADLHIGHSNAIRFDRRPFSSTGEMQNEIAKLWNETVRADDTVYIIGDFIMAKESEWPRILKEMSLSGKLVLIRGNHDPRGFSKETRSFFHEISDYKEIKDGDRTVIMSHYPMPFHKRAYSPNVWMVYGHVHLSREAALMERLRKEMRHDQEHPHDNRGQWLNAGCMLPWVGYRPRTLDELIAGEEPYIEAGLDWLIKPRD